MPIDETYHDVKTMDRVREALEDIDADGGTVEDMISSMQNAGILFRERPRGPGGRIASLNVPVSDAGWHAGEARKIMDEIGQQSRRSDGTVTLSVDQALAGAQVHALLAIVETLREKL
jgi:hypothetical protein